MLNRMYSSELLTRLKKESEKISNEDISLARAAIMEAVQYVPEPYRTIYSSDYFVFLYESFLKLKRHESVPDEQVDTDAYEAILRSIREKNINPDRKRKALGRFTCLVLVYLVFIMKEPLHPVGMVFPGGARITQIEPDYYCPVKDTQSETGISFCEFCVCRDSGELDKIVKK